MKSLVKKLIATSLVFFLVVITTGRISADTDYLSKFPACPIAGGALKVHYDSGTHAIAGNLTLYTGSDSVFTLDEGNFVQCYCPQNMSEGIQTDWLDATSIDESTRLAMRATGWVYIADGSVWDLGQKPLLAYNQPFQCQAPQVGGISVTSTPTPTETPTPTLNPAPTDIPAQGGSNPTAAPAQPSSISQDKRGGSSSDQPPIQEILSAKTLPATGSFIQTTLALGIIALGVGFLTYGTYFKKTT